MPSLRTLRLSFSSGEVSPLMFERVDLDKMANALAVCENMIVTPQGPVSSRKGLAFAAVARTAAGGGSEYARVIAFNYSQTQNFAIVISAGCFRFYAQGAALLAGALPVYSAVTAYAVGAAVAFNGLNYYCIAACTGQEPDVSGGFWYAMPVTGEYEIPNSYAAADLQTIHYVQSGDVITLVHPNYPPMLLERYGNTDWVFSPASFASVYTPPGSITASANYVNSGYPEHFTYQVTALDPLGDEESLPTAASNSVYNDLAVSGNYNTISWTAAVAPSNHSIGAYNVYKAINGGAFGYIAQLPPASLSFTDSNITPDMTQTPPQSETVFASAGNYPAAVQYYEERKFFAGTDDEPNNIWATQSGTESNMNYSIPSQASDALRFGIWAKGQNQVLHLVQSIDLMALTASNEFRIYTASGDALTPSTLSIKSQAQNGAANVMPVTVNNFVLYAQYNGGRIREMSFDWTIQGYKTVDISLLAQHLFDGFTIVDMAYTHVPNPIVWAINNQGQLLGMTYVPDQQVQAWHHHTTGDGDAFESMAVIPENGVDRLYLLVRRTVNGQTVRYVEYLDPPAVGALVDAFYVDSGASFSAPDGTYTAVGQVLSCAVMGHGLLSGQSVYLSFSDTGITTGPWVVTVADPNDFTVTVSGASATSGNVSLLVTEISGLTWLVGETVQVLADGNVMSPQVVSTGGAIDLDFPANTVQVGLKFVATMVTPPPVVQGDADLSQSRVKNINQIWARVYESGAFYAGPFTGDSANDQNSLVQVGNGVQFDPAQPVPLVSDVLQLSLMPSLNESGQILMQMSDPLPLTVVGVTLEVSVGG